MNEPDADVQSLHPCHANREAAADVLQLLTPGRLALAGNVSALPLALRNRSEIIRGFDNLDVNLYANPGFETLLNRLERLHSQASGVFWSDPLCQKFMLELESRIASYPWAEVAGLEHDIGDNIEYQLVALANGRLAYGHSIELVELCLLAFEHGFWPLGYEEDKDKLWLFCVA